MPTIKVRDFLDTKFYWLIYIDIGCWFFEVLEYIFVIDMKRSTIARWHLAFLRKHIIKNCGYDPEIRYQKERATRIFNRYQKLKKRK